MTDVTTVTCVCCENTFECFCDAHAHGCAANLVEGSIYGHYGSAVADLMCLKIDPKKLSLLPQEGVVCDDCITTWHTKGFIISAQMREAFEGNTIGVSYNEYNHRQ